MKIRIKGNSIRLRLTQAEVTLLGSDGQVAASTCFPGGRNLRYALRTGDHEELLHAVLKEDEIVLLVAAVAARDWVRSEKVSLRHELGLENGETLLLLVEKDFACLAPRADEDESDMYPHPAQQ